MNFGDKKKMMIVGGVAAAIVLLLVVFMMTRGKKTPAGAGAGGMAAAGRGGRAAQTATAPVPGQAGGAVPTAPVGAVGVAPATRLFSSVGVGTGEMSALTRSDPLVLLEAPPPVITPEEKTPLPPVSIVAGGLRVGPEGGTIGVIANRRVAGVKFNGGAWAILESEGQKSFVVKPGDVIDGTKITAISRDSIYITDPDGLRWQVPLRSAGPGGGATPITSRRLPGLPGSPGEDF